jgi:SAM-dependent methyltransferase
MISGHSSFDSENQNTFSNAAVAQHYVSMTSLFPPEARALDKIRSVVKGRPIMDIGVGSGRTTPYLLELSKDYVAIDYSPEMIARCRTRFPGVKFEVGDARRLEGYPTGYFGLLLFSFNGLDYVQHPDRMQILRECHRVVRDDGWFLFSSHNELWHSRASQPLAWRVLGQMRDSLRYLRHLKSLRPVRNPREGFSYRCERVFGNTQTFARLLSDPGRPVQTIAVCWICVRSDVQHGRRRVAARHARSKAKCLALLPGAQSGLRPMSGMISQSSSLL